MTTENQSGAEKAVATVDHLANVVGTLIPTVAAIGGAVRLLLTAVRPTDAQKAQAYDEASAVLKKAIQDGQAALAGFDEAKKQAEQLKAQASASVGHPVSAITTSPSGPGTYEGAKPVTANTVDRKDAQPGTADPAAKPGVSEG